MTTRHSIIPKGRTLDRMKCDVCHKPVEITRSKDGTRNWRHVKRDIAQAHRATK